MTPLTHRRISYPKDITKKTVSLLSVYSISTFKLTEIKSVVYTFHEACNTYQVVTERLRNGTKQRHVHARMTSERRTRNFTHTQHLKL